jgi:hypothetical protein
MVAQRPPGEEWQPARHLSPAGTMATQSALAVTPAGAATVAWRSRPVDNRRVRVVARTLEEGTWSPPAVLSDRDMPVAEDVRAAPGPGESVYVSWAHAVRGGELLRYAVRPGSGDWTGPRGIPGRGKNAPLFASSGGRVLRAWAATTRDEVFAHLMAQLRTRGGRWGTPVQLTPTGRPLEQITVRGDGAGRFRVIAETQPNQVGDTMNFRVKTFTVSRSGRFSALTRLSGRRVFEVSSALTLGPDRSVAVVWIQTTPRVARTQVTHTAIGP